MSKLKYFAENTLSDLKANIAVHIDRYRAADFEDRAELNGWSIELSSVEVDDQKFLQLDPSRDSTAEVSNSMIAFDAFNGMTPALATEERVWSRLTHFECLEYTRKRWPLEAEPKGDGGFLSGLTGGKKKTSEQRSKVLESNIKQVGRHFFAQGRTGYRDDNAVARLWWNAFIAWRVDPQDQKGVLTELLRTADIRSNLVERPMLSNRASLLRAIIGLMRSHPDVYGTEATFREFMKALNLRGSGVLFEALSKDDTDRILLKCYDDALRRVSVAQKVA